jgi:uncharacterized membrane protein
MESKNKFLGHALHPLLIVFPLGLLLTSIAFDFICMLVGSKAAKQRWADRSYSMIGAGLVTGVVAAIFGYGDWRAIPEGTRAKFVGLVHGAGNMLVTGLFAASWLIRHNAKHKIDGGAFALSLLGGAIASATGWLGGELVERLRVGVDDGAHLNAPSSLQTQDAYEHVDDPKVLV